MTPLTSDPQTTKERFVEHLRQGIEHLKALTGAPTDNAVISQVSAISGIRVQSMWNWLDSRKTTLPHRSSLIKFIKAAYQMALEEPLPNQWDSELMRKGNRKHEKEAVYQKLVSEAFKEVKKEIEGVVLAQEEYIKQPPYEAQLVAVQVPSQKRGKPDSSATGSKVHARTKPNATAVIAISIGWWLFVGCLPLLVLIIEFGGGKGVYLARVYPHLFFQPFFFGPLLGIGAAALIQVFSYYRRLTNTLLICTVIGFATTLPEVFTGDTALWEVSPRMMLERRGDQDVHFSHFHALLNECQGEQNVGQNTNCGVMEATYGNALRSYALDIKHSSVTRWFYMLSVFVYISTIGLFVLIADFLRRERVQLEKDETSFHNLGVLCGWSTVIISLWFPLRLATDVIKRSLYPDANAIPTITLLMLFVVVCGYFLLTYYNHPTTVLLFAITLSILACSIGLFFVQPSMLVSIVVGTLSPTGFTENVQIAISKYLWPLMAMLVFSWQQSTELITGRFRLWSDDF